MQSISFAFPGIPTVGCLFTTSLAGNYSLLAEKNAQAKTIARREQLIINLELEHLAEVYQVHGDTFVQAEPAEVAKAPIVEADGMHTRVKKLGLIIKTADCQAILFAKKDGSAIAAIHSGWRGNVQKYSATALEQFCTIYSCAPNDVMAVRGPSLGPAASEFVNFEQEWPKEFMPWFTHVTNTMNLWELTKAQLVHAGMLHQDIFSLDLCTWSLPDMFFSYRRGHTGRQLGVVWIK